MWQGAKLLNFQMRDLSVDYYILGTEAMIKWHIHGHADAHGVQSICGANRDHGRLGIGGGHLFPEQGEQTHQETALGRGLLQSNEPEIGPQCGS